MLWNFNGLSCSSKVWKSDKPTHPVALWESSNASHNLPALELLNSQHSLEIGSVCHRLLVELDCSQNSSSSILSKVVITRKSPASTTSFKGLKFHRSNDRSRARKSQLHACADVFQLCLVVVVSSTTPNTVQSRRPASQASAGINPLFLGDFLSFLCFFFVFVNPVILSFFS